jgi:hypothetical protein
MDSTATEDILTGKIKWLAAFPDFCNECTMERKIIPIGFYRVRHCITEPKSNDFPFIALHFLQALGILPVFMHLDLPETIKVASRANHVEYEEKLNNKEFRSQKARSNA